MNLNELVKKYRLLLDKRGRYYKLEDGKMKEPWVTINFLSRNFNASRYNIKLQLKGNVPSEKINPRYGPPCDFYNLNDVLKACSGLFKKIPIANSRGIAIIKGQKYASVRTLSRLFELSSQSIISRIKCLNPKVIKDERNRIIDAFNLRLAKKACADLLQKFSFADENGFATINGKKYASIKTIAKKNEVSYLMVEQRVKEKKFKIAKIKLECGRIVDAYNTELVDRICADLKDMPKANKNGIATFNGESYATIYVIAKKLKLHYSSIQRIIKVNKIQPKNIEVEHGQIRAGFCIKAVKKASRNLLKKLPVADKKGIAIIAGEEYTTITTMSRKWDKGENLIKKMVKKYNLKPKKIRFTASTIYNAYNVNATKKACSDPLENYTIANSNGIATINRERYATVSKIAQLLSCQSREVKELIKTHKINPRKIKYPKRVYEAYNINQVKAFRQSDIKSRPQKGEILLIGQEKYATISRLTKMFKIHRSTLKARLNKLKFKKIRGQENRYLVFYKIKDAKLVCSDLISLPKTDKTGNVRINNEKHASMKSLSKTLDLSVITIKKRIINVKPKRAKNIWGRNINVYNVVHVKNACSDINNDNLLIPDEKGWAKKNGQLYAPIFLLSKELKMARKSLRARIGHLTPVEGKNKIGIKIGYFNFNQVKKACPDLVGDEILIPDENNWAYKNGVPYATINKISGELGINASTLRSRIVGLPPAKGRTKTGNPINYYNFLKAKKICSDLL